MQKPELEHIDGLSPAIAIEQQNLGNTPRSTVGTVTEIYDYLRILMARGWARPTVPTATVPSARRRPTRSSTRSWATRQGPRLYLMAPVGIEVGQQYETLWDELRAKGYVRIRVDGTTALAGRRRPRSIAAANTAVEVVVDRIVIRRDSRSRIAESVEAALALGRGVLHVAIAEKDVPEPEWQVDVHSQHLACDQCGRSFEPLTPHSFSFNSPLGWCRRTAKGWARKPAPIPPRCSATGSDVGRRCPAAVARPRSTRFRS